MQNKLILFVVFLMFFQIKLFAQFDVSIEFKHPPSLAASDTIYYNAEEKLGWTNFQGNPVMGGKAGAITTAGFGYKARLHADKNRTDFIVSVYSFFSKSKSWVKPDKKTAYVLNHEQKHFDIAYIGTCLFIKKLRETKFTQTNYRNLLGQVYNEMYTYMNDLQDLYDSETNNGQLENKQEEWNKRIDDLLIQVNSIK